MLSVYLSNLEKMIKIGFDDLYTSHKLVIRLDQNCQKV